MARSSAFPGARRPCPTCGAPTDDDQLVCLECGSRVALDYRRPPSWRVPVAIIAAVIVLVAAASAIALAQIGDDAKREAARTPIDVKRGAEPKAGGTDEPAGELTRQGILYRWPPALGGFTVVLLRTADRAEADDFARTAAEDRPAKIGVIRADDFGNLEDGFFLVFAGRYASSEEADRAADRLRGRFGDAFVQRIRR